MRLSREGRIGLGLTLLGLALGVAIPAGAALGIHLSTVQLRVTLLGSIALAVVGLGITTHAFLSGTSLRRHRPSWAPKLIKAPAGSVPKVVPAQPMPQLSIEPEISGLWIRLKITNHGRADVRLRARITEVYGAVEGTLRVSRSLAWTVDKNEQRRLRPGIANAELVDVAESDGMGTYTTYPKPARSEAGIFRFQTIGGVVTAHLPTARGSADLYTNTLSVAVAFVGQDYRNHLTAEVELGFENRNDPSTGNLMPRARLVKMMP